MSTLALRQPAEAHEPAELRGDVGLLALIEGDHPSGRYQAKAVLAA